MSVLPHGSFHHCPWDFDPEWFPGKEYPPPPLEKPDEPFLFQSKLSDDNPHASQPEADFQKGRAPLAIADWSQPRPPMRMLQAAYLDIMQHLSAVPPEAGGMLL